LYLENCWQAYITVTVFSWFDARNSLLKSVQAYYEYIHSVKSNPPSGREGGGARFSAPVQTRPGAHPASCTTGKGKGKVHPIAGHKDPKEEQRFSSTLSLTSELDWVAWSTPRPSYFTPGKDPVHIV